MLKPVSVEHTLINFTLPYGNRFHYALHTFPLQKATLATEQFPSFCGTPHFRPTTAPSYGVLVETSNASFHGGFVADKNAVDITASLSLPHTTVQTSSVVFSNR
jgi:hypothetical protein